MARTFQPDRSDVEMTSPYRLRYKYKPLPTELGKIRLLHLLPSEDEHAPIHGKLVEYPLKTTGSRRHLYEALSYVWGSEEKPDSIVIENHELLITKSLHEALLRLRNHAYERYLWVDAVCINQDDDHEKEHQIGFMPQIYGHAKCVIVWLGEMAENSGNAIEAIRSAAREKSSISRSDDDSMWKLVYASEYGPYDDVGLATKNDWHNQKLGISPDDYQAVVALLQRPWFRRIWVLQEVAMVRQINIVCGKSELDGHAFGSGVDVLSLSHRAGTDLPGIPPNSVNRLIRDAVFRPQASSENAGQHVIDARSLRELLDRYRTHLATKPHDKVYALLGMCSDDISKAGLQPDYSLPWQALSEQLFQWMFGHSTTAIRHHAGAVTMQCRGLILGIIDAVSNSPEKGEVSIRMTLTTRDGTTYRSRYFHFLHISADPVVRGDIVCLLDGNQFLTVVRLRHGRLVVIVTATPPPLVLRRDVPNTFSCLGPLPPLSTHCQEISWPRILESTSSTKQNLRLLWQWDGMILGDAFPKESPRAYSLPGLWPWLSGCKEPNEVCEYLRAAKISLHKAPDEVSHKTFVESNDFSGDPIAEFLRGNFGSELLAMLEEIDGEDVSLEIRSLVDCLGSHAEFMWRLFKKRMSKGRDQTLEILFERERSVPFDHLLWHALREAEADAHWIIVLLERTGAKLSEAMLDEVLSYVPLNREHDRKYFPERNQVKLKTLLKQWHERSPITEEFIVRMTKLGIAPSTRKNLHCLDCLLHLIREDQEVDRDRPVDRLFITESLLKKAAMSWDGIRVHYGAALIQIVGKLGLPDDNPLTEEVYSAIGSYEWTVEQIKAVKDWSPEFNREFLQVFDTSNRPYGGRLTSEEKRAAWKDLADYCCRHTRFARRSHARWLIERLPKRAGHWRDVWSDLERGIYPGDYYRSKEGKWLTRGQISAATEKWQAEHPDRELRPYFEFHHYPPMLRKATK
ncbi:hypothetical protein FKW77_007866 [Venturia effusa]|uniref:Heterokaryon incompatibility domain-containing protein n=1 Tax=Venturia effusa TaxID=50376 RepID=A0A517KWV9_9PEZI|nr:hypothetical protein FKW77_007866 [Venturia effusa]